ncbi:hypothetical protein ACM7NO_26475 [Pseudomonas aeruginosa]
MTSVHDGKKQTALQMRAQRCNAANEFIQVIASCGRHFFRDRGAGHNGFLSLNPRGTIVWFHDDYTGQRINISKEGDWAGFSHGGTLKGLLQSIGRHVLAGSRLRHGYFQPVMDNGFNNPWGYEEDILLVRAAGIRLGLVSAPAEPTGTPQQETIA